MTTPADPFDLARFVEAQASSYAHALAELRAGEKRSHWMWYVFPQIAGLGRSDTARRYAIQSRAEAEAYLAHLLLGPRLVECCEAVLTHLDKSAFAIFGSPDDVKLRSCVTLFDAVAPGGVFGQVLNQFFGGVPDGRTLELLAGGVIH